MPGTECVRREAGVDHRERGLEALVGEVRVVAGELFGFQQPLVDDDVGGQRDDVEAVVARRLLLIDRVLQDAAADVELVVQVLTGRAVLGGDDELGDFGLGFERRGAQVAVVGGDRPPAEHLEALTGQFRLDECLQVRRGLVVVVRQKKCPDRIRPRFGEVGVYLVGEELVGNLEHDTRAVAGTLLGAGGPPVFEVLQKFEPVCNGAVVALAVEVHDDPDAAVRPFVSRVCEPGLAHRLVTAVSLNHMCAHLDTTPIRGCSSRD